MAQVTAAQQSVGESSADLRRAALDANGKSSSQSVSFIGSAHVIVTANNPLEDKFGHTATVVTEINNSQVLGQIVIKKRRNGWVAQDYEVGADGQFTPINNLSDAIPFPAPPPKGAGRGFMRHLKRSGQLRK